MRNSATCSSSAWTRASRSEEALDGTRVRCRLDLHLTRQEMRKALLALACRAAKLDDQCRLAADQHVEFAPKLLDGLEPRHPLGAGKQFISGLRAAQQQQSRMVVCDCVNEKRCAI